MVDKLPSDPALTSVEFGYARVSTDDQRLDLQLAALERAGVDPGRIFSDRMSGMRGDRPGWNACKKALRAGDAVVVWKLDRLGRSTLGVLKELEALTARNVAVRSLTESIDGRTPYGRFLITILAGLAQMERDLISERTRAGLATRKERGVVLGRKSVMTPEREASARLMLEADMPRAQIARKIGVSKSAFFKWVALERARTDVGAKNDRPE